jgi:hypothetical protein
MSGPTVKNAVEQMSGVIERFLGTSLDNFTQRELSQTIKAFEKFQNFYYSYDDLDILMGLVSQAISHLYVARGYATTDIPRPLEYYRSMEAIRNLFRTIKRMK